MAPRRTVTMKTLSFEIKNNHRSQIEASLQGKVDEAVIGPQKSCRTLRPMGTAQNLSMVMHFHHTNVH